jgi:predicted DNA-binding transcriptional regulator AlpA
MEKLLKVKDVMNIYGISKRTLYNWIDRGLPVLRNKGVVRFKANEVEEWFNKE